MSTLQEYLEHTYGPPAGLLPLVRQQEIEPEQVHVMPSESSVSVVDDASDSSSPVPADFEDVASDIDPQAGSDTSGDTEEDTEEEDNTELEKYYLNKARKEKKDVGTVFGKGIRVWKFHEDTVYTHIEGETINGAAMITRKRKRTQKRRFTAFFSEQDDDMPNDQILVQQSMDLPESKKRESSEEVLAPNSFTLSFRPATTTEVLKPHPVVEYHIRAPDSVSTIFHHGSAAINPLGAYARPILPTKRPSPLVTPPPPAFTTSNVPSATPVPEKPVVEKRRRVVSGSFGTFEGAPGRFGKRPYQLLPGKSEDERARAKRVDGIEDLKRVPEMGMEVKKRPWLRK